MSEQVSIRPLGLVYVLKVNSKLCNNTIMPVGISFSFCHNFPLYFAGKL